jgi:dihydroxyacetone kinase-like protein
VALATGGGSGHLPVFLGYVGKGMLDGCAVGDVFASPTADQMLEVTQRIHGGGRRLHLRQLRRRRDELRHGRRDGVL